MDKIRALLVEPQKKPRKIELARNPHAFKDAVGGELAKWSPYGNDMALVFDEEAKCTGRPYNRALRDDDGKVFEVIGGTFVVVGLTDGKVTSLTDDVAAKYMEHFKTTERFLWWKDELKIFPMKLPTLGKKAKLKEVGR